MHERTAAALINCMLPLVRSNRDLQVHFTCDYNIFYTILQTIDLILTRVAMQDYIILVVRKAMFRREEPVRVAATKAMMDLILIQSGFCRSDLNQILDSSSQASSSQQVEVNSGLCKRLFEDLSGLLRRCLSQQVRFSNY